MLKIILPLCLFVLLSFPPSYAGEQAQRAIRTVKDLIAQGAIPQDSVLKLIVKQGNIHNYWGDQFALKKEWEEQTGILLDANVRPQLPVIDFMQQNHGFDLTVARNRAYPDLFTQGLIEDLTPFMRQYGPDLSEDKSDSFVLPHQQAWFADRLVAMPADGDVALMYLRKDLLADPQRRKAYRKRYGQELRQPDTWAEYQRQVEFFHDSASGFFGACEQRDPLTGWMFWTPRYASQSNPNQYLFDEQMKPLIDSPAGIAATESYLATIPYSPPDILLQGNDYSYTLPFYMRGKCYSYILTPAAAKIFSLDSSTVKGNFVAQPLPGVMLNGQLVRRTTLIYGNNLVIAASSKQKELAYLYLLWLSDPDISARSVAVRKGFADPFRRDHLIQPQVLKAYTPQALQVLEESYPLTIPAGTGLPGDTEYLDALNENLWRAGKGELSAAEAMKATASAWEEITERYGRQQQIRYWLAQKEKYPH